MLTFLADENFHRAILRGLRHRCPDLDIERVQDVGLRRADDPTIWEWAVQSGRVLLTYDEATVPRFACERLAAGLPMPGVIRVPDTMTFAQAIEELLLIAKCSRAEEWEGRIVRLPV